MIAARTEILCRRVLRLRKYVGVGGKVCSNTFGLLSSASSFLAYTLKRYGWTAKKTAAAMHERLKEDRLASCSERLVDCVATEEILCVGGA